MLLFYMALNNDYLVPYQVITGKIVGYHVALNPHNVQEIE